MTRKTVYNNLVTEELLKQVNPENKELVEEFLEYLSSVGRSKETIFQYQHDLNAFFCWYITNGKNKHFTELKKREVIKFQGYLLNECGMSSARIRRLRSALSSLSNYIENFLDDDYEDFRNIINKIEAPTLQPVREKTILKMDEVIRVCDKLLDEGKIQLSAFLAVAVYSGLRKQELIRLLYEDFTSKKNIVYSSFYKTSPIKLKGNRDKRESKLVWNKCDKYLLAWLDYRKQNNIECEYLFCRKVGNEYKQLIVPTVNSFVDTYNKYFDKILYMHSLRHLYSTYLLESGIPPEVVQMLLSHTDVSTTLKFYDDRDKNEALGNLSDFFSGKVDKIDNNRTLNSL